MSANMELITSHQGTPHITTDQITDLLSGISGNTSGIERFSNLDDGFTHVITSGLEVTISRGQAIAGGWFFQLLAPYKWELDPVTVGYSRIDDLYIVIYEDQDTMVQTCDFAYQPGTPYPNGTAGTPPMPPVGVDVKEAFRLFRATVVSGTIDVVTDYSEKYLTPSAVSAEIDEVGTELSGEINDIWSTLGAVVEYTPAAQEVTLTAGQITEVTFTLPRNTPGSTISITGITPCVAGNGVGAIDRVTSDFLNGEYHVYIAIMGVTGGTVNVAPTIHYLEF